MAKEKKIIVDEDWKEEAAKEKEVLAAQEKAEKAEKEEKEEQQEQRQLPPADFSGLISMLATQAFFALGVIRTKEDEEPKTDMALAQYNIDILGIIEEKTKGNLTDEEKKLLEGTIHQLRMAFVQVTQKKD
jgi:hypothetical protein